VIFLGGSGVGARGLDRAPVPIETDDARELSAQFFGEKSRSAISIDEQFAVPRQCRNDGRKNFRGGRRL
jgi:hypothetical protein